MQVSDSLYPMGLYGRSIAGQKLQTPKGPGLAGPAAGLNAGLGAAPLAPQPQLATAQGVQALAQQQGLPVAAPAPAPIAKLGGQNWQVAKSALGAPPPARQREPVRDDALFDLLRGRPRRSAKRAAFFPRNELRTYGQQPALLTASDAPPQLDPQLAQMRQLLGLDAQLAQGQGALENPSQEALQELELQKTVLSRAVGDEELTAFMVRTGLLRPGMRLRDPRLKAGREVPIKNWFTNGKAALPNKSNYAQKKKPGSQGASYERLKQAGLSDIGAGFLAQALNLGLDSATIGRTIDKRLPGRSPDSALFLFPLLGLVPQVQREAPGAGRSGGVAFPVAGEVPQGGVEAARLLELPQMRNRMRGDGLVGCVQACSSSHSAMGQPFAGRGQAADGARGQVRQLAQQLGWLREALAKGSAGALDGIAVDTGCGNGAKVLLGGCQGLPVVVVLQSLVDTHRRSSNEGSDASCRTLETKLQGVKELKQAVDELRREYEGLQEDLHGTGQ